MDIDTPLRELGRIDSDALREAILAQDEIAWNEDIRTGLRHPGCHSGRIGSVFV